MTKVNGKFTSPEEGLKLLEEAEKEHGCFENIPEVDFTIEIDPKKYKTKLKSIRLTEYIIDGYEDLSKIYNIKPQTLIKAVLEEYLNKNYKQKHP